MSANGVEIALKLACQQMGDEGGREILLGLDFVGESLHNLSFNQRCAKDTHVLHSVGPPTSACPCVVYKTYNAITHRKFYTVTQTGYSDSLHTFNFFDHDPTTVVAVFHISVEEILLQLHIQVTEDAEACRHCTNSRKSALSSIHLVSLIVTFENLSTWLERVVSLEQLVVRVHDVFDKRDSALESHGSTAIIRPCTHTHTH